jgi:hypothetical protein
LRFAFAMSISASLVHTNGEGVAVLAPRERCGLRRQGPASPDRARCSAGIANTEVGRDQDNDFAIPAS